MYNKNWIKQTVDQYLAKTIKTSHGCWIIPTSVCSPILCSDGEIRTATKAILFEYGQEYRYMVLRTCKNSKCMNPDHLKSFSEEERFWYNVDISDDESVCWEWHNLAGTGRYGSTKFRKKETPTHRIAYMLHYKTDIPEGLYVCHHCDNPPCCNPYHLFLGTHQDNIDDRERKGRNKMPHSRGEEHGHHKLTENDVKKIRSLYVPGKFGYRNLSKIFDVTPGQIRNVIKGNAWGWLE